MCNRGCLDFGKDVIERAHVEGLRVLEVGSYDVNGSLRETVMALEPREYVGVDILAGPGVDCICPAERLTETFGERRWDLVVCTEVLEHVWDWPATVSNLKRSLATGGHLLLTTRSVPFPYHSYPFDYWRFDPEDMAAIFADLSVLRLVPDLEPGVLLYASRPEGFREIVYSMAIYSMEKNRRIQFKDAVPA